MEHYIDPNSGAAPQPGGFSAAAVPEEGTEQPAQATEEPTQAEARVGATEAQPDENAGQGDGTLQAQGESESQPVGEAPNDEMFDPSEHTVDEVKAYVEQNPDERDEVLAAEEEGKNRSTLVTWLEDS